jgi:hypothetical protein
MRREQCLRRLLTTILGFCVFLASNSRLKGAGSFHFQSEATPTPLLELYTSEGCSSCPPAEAWLSRLKGSPRLWKDFVPVAFHVDYWDYLGWKDPFASKAYTQRQRDYAAFWRSRSVYTPGFVLDGKEWRGWFDRDDLPRPASKLVGVLAARSDDGRQWTLRYQPAAGTAFSSFDFHAALLGLDLTSDVKAGENRGRRLEHDFVVLDLAKATSPKDGETFQTMLSVDSKLIPSAKRLAFAAWVKPSRNLQPVQSLGGWLTSTNRVP